MLQTDQPIVHWRYWRSTALAPKFQKFFNFPTCSDVQIVFPPHSYAQNMAVMESSGIQRVPHGDAAVIHAHRFILAAGSEYFSRKLQEPEYMKDSVVIFHPDKEDGIAAMIDAIKHIYGLAFPDDCYGIPLYLFASIGAVAEKYGIAGLSEEVLKAAHRQLVYKLDSEEDPEALEGFFGLGTVGEEYHNAGAPRTKISPTNTAHYAFAVSILGQSLKVIRKIAPFQKLLKEVPQLAIDLLNLMAEENDELEGKQKKIKDSK